jgi:Mce-associated membrane protein
MLAITSPRNGYRIPRVSYTAVTTECDASDCVAAPASQRDVAVGGPPEERRQIVAGGRRRARLLVLLGLVLGMTIGALAGWLGYRALYAQREVALRVNFVQTARLGPPDLTTIDYAHADSDLQSILDGATATFRDDFPSHSQPLVVAVQFNSPPRGDPCLQGCI